MSRDLVVQASGLTKTYHKGDIPITPVDGADIDVASGELVAIMGPSGSGKSTLLHLLGGLDKPDQGSCNIGGTDITSMSERQLCDFRATNIGFVFQVYNLVPVLTARENIDLPLRLLSLSRERRQQQTEAALELVSLADRADHLPSQLSGGEEQRVAIARALATDPKVILADEPTGNLDEDSGRLVMDILQTLSRDYGKTIVVVTHDSQKAGYADRVLFMHKGRLVTERPGSVREVA